ncbi:MAG: HAD-IIIA family hydrolase [Patescibacteria group bacterium]
MDASLKEKFSRIKLLATDFDGVMTDGLVYVDQDGKETVRCSRKDGMGVELLKKHGVTVGVLSKETNPVVTARCNKLKIPVWQGIATGEGKLEILQRIMKEQNLSVENVAYIGDDVNDLPSLKFAGLTITVADGHQLVKNIAHYTTSATGGHHAVREIADLILSAKGINLEI